MANAIETIFLHHAYGAVNNRSRDNGSARFPPPLTIQKQ
jgi:hypothetical protein